MQKKIILIFFSLILLSSLLGCKHNVAEKNDSQTEDSENETELSEDESDGKTYLEITNSSQFDVRIYLQTVTAGDPWASVKVGETVKQEISASATKAGDGINIQYLYKIGDVIIPYFDTANPACSQAKVIKEGISNPIKISRLDSIPIDKKYLLIKNITDKDVALQDSSDKYITPLYQENYWITVDNYCVFDITDINSLEGYKIGNGIDLTELNVGSVSQGIIYSLIFTSEGAELISAVPIDIAAQSKIWKIGLSQKSGKYLTSDKFSRREKTSDGYFFTGQLSYNEDFRNTSSSPYIAEIKPDGTIDDKVSYFKNKPDAMRSNVFIEKNGCIITGGVQITGEKENVFLYGDGECDFYSVIDSIQHLDNTVKLIHKDDETFGLLYIIYDDEEDKCGFGIYEFSVNSTSSVEGKIVYEKLDDVTAEDFIYANGEYVVLGQDYSQKSNSFDKSSFIFIDGVKYTETAKKSIDSYLLNAMESSSDGTKAFASGSVINSKTGKDVAVFVQIDLKKRDLISEDGIYRFPSSDATKNSNFTYLAVNGNELFLGGFIERDYIYDSSDYSSGYPYLVAYDIEKNRVRYKNCYNDALYKEYEIQSCTLSDLSTPLIELYNAKTRDSFLVSCGILGEIPLEPLTTLPKSTEIQSAPVPDMTVTVIDFEENEIEISKKYGDSLNFDEIKGLLTSANCPEGKEVSGFAILNENESLESVSFPFVIQENEQLYVQYCLAAPTGFYASEVTASTIKVTWDSNDFAAKYDLEWSVDNDFASIIDRVSLTSENSYLVSSLNCEQIYYFRICAYDESGGQSSYSIFYSQTASPIFWTFCKSGDTITGNRESLEGYSKIRIKIYYTEQHYFDGEPLADFYGWEIGCIWNTDNNSYTEIYPVKVIESLTLYSSIITEYDCDTIKSFCNNFGIGNFSDSNCYFEIYLY